MRTPPVLSTAERTLALVDLPDWRFNLDSLHTAYACASAAAALELVQAIGERAESLDHHPDVDWRYRHVFVTVTTHSAGGRVTAADMELAGEISIAAARAGAVADPELPKSFELAVDTDDPAAITATWIAALGFEQTPTGELADPWRRLPGVWFQQTDQPNSSRMHVDLTVEAGVADAIVERAVAHGGRRIDDRFRPSFTVLADAQDNRICICTNLGRDDE